MSAFYPTIAGIFKLKNIPDYLEGKNFAENVQNPYLPFRKAVRSIIKRGTMLGKTVKTLQWRYTEWDEGNRNTELYDETSDPDEYINLAANPAYSSIIVEMKKILNQKE